MNRFIKLPLYPFFAAIYPVLALLSFNLGEVKANAGIRPMLFSILITAVLLLLMKQLYRNWHRAAFASAGLALLFFTYGQVYDAIFDKWNTPNLIVWMVTTWTILALTVLVLAALRNIRFEAAAVALNIILFGLLVYPTVQIIQDVMTQTPSAAREPYFKSQDLNVSTQATLPDIYYIMPEDYGRVDLLGQRFDIDVTSFMQNLKDMGFYVAECSQSNYPTSVLSLGSSLNMEYLQNLDKSFDPKSINQHPIWNSITNSAVVADLKKAGYKTVAFATGFAWSELDNSDVYYSPSPLTSGVTNFESLLLRTTPIRYVNNNQLFNLDEIDGQQYRERTMLIFNSMESLAKMPGPKFVFVHLIIPHEPFVFGPDGSPIDPAPFLNEKRRYTFDAYKLGFQNEIPFLNTKLEESLKTLIADSARPPVIILQTDTSPLFMTGSDQFKILNAYYMPGHTDMLYPNISPVNTFRVLFNTYFGTDYPLLDDISYDSPIPHIYDFTKIPNAKCDAP